MFETVVEVDDTAIVTFLLFSRNKTLIYLSKFHLEVFGLQQPPTFKTSGTFSAIHI